MIGFDSDSTVVREDNGTVLIVLVKSGESAVGVSVEFTTENRGATCK